MFIIGNKAFYRVTHQINEPKIIAVALHSFRDFQPPAVVADCVPGRGFAKNILGFIAPFHETVQDLRPPGNFAQPWISFVSPYDPVFGKEEYRFLDRLAHKDFRMGVHRAMQCCRAGFLRAKQDKVGIVTVQGKSLTWLTKFFNSAFKSKEQYPRNFQSADFNPFLYKHSGSNPAESTCFN